MDTSNVLPDRGHTDSKRIARVVSVSGGRLIALLDATVGEDGVVRSDAPQIGELVKIATRGSTVFGVVAGLNIPLPDDTSGQKELRIIEVELIGEIERIEGDKPVNFQRGISF